MTDITDLVDSLIKVDSTVRDNAISAAQILIAGKLQVASSAIDTTETNMILAISITARNIIATKRASGKEKNLKTPVPVMDAITKEVEDLIMNLVDEDLTEKGITITAPNYSSQYDTELNHWSS